MEFDTNTRVASVHGFVTDGVTRLENRTVEIRYPVAGVITAFTDTTDANGYFNFTSVPFGTRSLAVTDAPTIGPVTMVIDKSQFEVPISTMNYLGALQNITLAEGSVTTDAPDDTIVSGELISTFTTDRTLDYITIIWAVPGYSRCLTSVTINAVQQGIAGTSTGTRVDITANMIIPANTAGNTFNFRFNRCSNLNDADMDNGNYSVNFEWEEGGSDLISFGT